LRIRFYIDPSTGAPHILNHQVGEDEVADVLEGPGEDRAGGEGSRIALGQTASGRLPQAEEEEQDDIPLGWDKEKVQRVLAHYEGQSEEEAVAEDEDAMRPSETLMSVPPDLVPKVRELIAKRRG
jgi:hypothetical protein